MADNNSATTDASIHKILNLNHPSEQQLEKVQNWVHDAWGDPYSDKPSLEFRVKDAMFKGKGRAVLPLFT
jgi:hypothetical protein